MFETDHAGNFSWMNSAVARVLGYTPDQLVGTHYLALVRADYRDSALSFYMRQLHERNPCTYYELPVVRADGREVWLGQNVQLVEVQGEPTGIRAVARDITIQTRVAESQRNLALRDHTTDLYSPRGFHALSEDRIKLALRTNHKLILLSAHVSGVREAEKAQEFLAVAGLLESTFRLSDVVARLRDRHFAVLALERHERDSGDWLAAVAGRLRNSARDRAFPDHLVLTLGIAFSGAADDCTPERLLSLAAITGDVGGDGDRAAAEGTARRPRRVRPARVITIRSRGAW